RRAYSNTARAHQSTMTSIDALPNETLARICYFVCGSQPSSAFHLAKVSKQWNDVTKAWALTPDFYKNLDNFKDPSLFPEKKGLAAHIHIANGDVLTLDQKTQACMARIGSALSCLQIWVGPDTVPFLSSAHPELLQLVLSRPPTAMDGDDSGANSANWVPPPTAPRVPWLPKLRSLHLIDPYPEVLAALSVTPYLPDIVELCITIPSFVWYGRETLVASLSKLLSRVGGTLEVLTLRCGLLPQGVAQPPLARLDNLKEFTLYVLDDMGAEGHSLPFNLSTPKLEKLIDLHVTFSGLYHTGVSKVITLADWSPEFHPGSYNMLPKVETIYVSHQHKLDMLKTYLQANRDVCPSLKLIVLDVRNLPGVSEEDWQRDTTTTIKVRKIPDDQVDAYKILTKQPWACDACVAPHEPHEHDGH
ncbi:hypothetical protein FRB91_001105, partial [Serendipita sp. 411]